MIYKFENKSDKKYRMSTLYEGDLVIANDDLNIVNDCIGEIHSIDKSNNGEKIYTVKFDTGTFLLKENQIGGIE